MEIFHRELSAAIVSNVDPVTRRLDDTARIGGLAHMIVRGSGAIDFDSQSCAFGCTTKGGLS